MQFKTTIFYWKTASLFIAFSLIQLCMAEPQRPLTSYPTHPNLWIGSEKVLLQYNNEQTISASSRIRFQLHTDETFLAKDLHWATLNPEALDHERKSVALEQRKTQLAIEQLTDHDMAALLKIEKDLLQNIDDTQSLKQAQQLKGISTKVRKQIKEKIKKLSDQRDRLQKKIDTEAYKQESILKKEELELNLENKKHSLENLEYHSQLKAQFPGDLSLSLPKKDIDRLNKGETIWVEPNKDFAKIVDKTSYNAELTPSSTIFQDIDPKKLTLYIPHGTQGQITNAKYLSSKTVNTNHGIEEQWIFKISKEKIEGLEKSVNKTLLANIFYSLPPGTHIVPKRDLVHINPSILEQQGWKGLIQHLWPGAKIIRIGPQAIAIQP